ncbi:MAG: fibronectin type III domain-containing protein [Acidobacteriota bacterium]
MNRYRQGYPARGRFLSGTAGRFIGLGVALLVLGCGKKGPPLPPLSKRPAPVTGFQVRQIGTTVQLSFRLPRYNLDGTGAGDVTLRVFRRPTRIEDSAPERRDWLERNFFRGAETIQSVRSDELSEIPDEPGTVFLIDPTALGATRPGFILEYRVLVLGAGSDRGTVSSSAFVDPRSGLAPPENLRLRDTGEGIFLEWNPTGDFPQTVGGGAEPRRFNLYRAAGAGSFPGNPITSRPLEEASFLDRARPPEGGTFRYRVREVFPSPFTLLESGDSVEVQVSTPRIILPPPPTDLTLAVTGALVRLIWIPPSGAMVGGFRIFRSSEVGSGWELVGEVAASEVSFTDRHTSPGIVYHYRVSSFAEGDLDRQSEPAGPVSGSVDRGIGGVEE